ncbi:hypothetical protein KY290_029838 [Solanum tuberosum]|uniref:Secreted protein n=1 Tax=Solanum tuberosum TaxID=4113 RepID=A0ABQ7UNU7_SOLTU|nr:hypothetical protein KY285_028720 [Solanum tuberosum]KAH0715940.1 hypothetical protein KY284_008845 [Solanum tuberosum]KAH0747136.1 hypothetical protein KY285_008793 [Solanum tuberosum]KAH0750606.1 hypothetical protein KY290_029838 [Solanum tuberosum]
MGGIAIFALALVPPFFLSDTGNAASKIPSRDGMKSHKSQKVIDDKARPPCPSASAIGLEMAARDCSLRTHCFLAALLLEFSKLLLALRPRITALTPRKPNGFENRPWSLPSY